MKSKRHFFRLALFCIAIILVSPGFLSNAQAFRGEREGFIGGGERERGYAEGPRGGAVAEDAGRGVVVRGPEGNVAVGRRVGDRVAFLPDSAVPVEVGDQTYWVDGSSVYYLPCDDDNTVYCVVPAPPNN